MTRRVFYSFHYIPDSWRASQVRNIGAVEGNQPASDNDWESVKGGGDAAIEKWIDGQLDGRTCTVVLVGSDTAKRKWIDYEIHKSWNSGKGIVGIHIHNLKDTSQKQSKIGANPFEHITMKRDNGRLSSIVKTYNPPYSDSKQAYDYIKQNLRGWIEEAVKIRNSY